MEDFERKINDKTLRHFFSFPFKTFQNKPFWGRDIRILLCTFIYECLRGFYFETLPCKKEKRL